LEAIKQAVLKEMEMDRIGDHWRFRSGDMAALSGSVTPAQNGSTILLPSRIDYLNMACQRSTLLIPMAQMALSTGNPVI